MLTTSPQALGPWAGATSLGPEQALVSRLNSHGAGGAGEDEPKSPLHPWCQVCPRWDHSPDSASPVKSCSRSSAPRLVDPLGWKSLKKSPRVLVAGSQLQPPSISCPTSGQQHPQPSPFAGAGISSWCERSVERRNATQASGHFFSYIQLSLTTQENWFKALDAQVTRPEYEEVLPPCGHFP